MGVTDVVAARGHIALHSDVAPSLKGLKGPVALTHTSPVYFYLVYPSSYYLLLLPHATLYYPLTAWKHVCDVTLT